MLQIDDLTGEELDQVERFVGEPIFGLLKAGEVAASIAEWKARQQGEADGITGERLEEHLTAVREQAMLAKMPTRLFVALAGVERQRDDPTFTAEKWWTLKPLKAMAAGTVSPFGPAANGSTRPATSGPKRTAPSPATTAGPSTTSGA